MSNYVKLPMYIECCLMVLCDEKIGFEELFLFLFGVPRFLLADYFNVFPIYPI